MGQATHVGGLGGELPAIADLLAGKDVPDPEPGPDLAATGIGHLADHQNLGVDRPPVGKARRLGYARVALDERARIHALEERGGFEVGERDIDDLRTGTAASEGGHRHRDRFDHASGDVELDQSGGRALGQEGCGERDDHGERKGLEEGGDGDADHLILLSGRVHGM